MSDMMMLVVLGVVGIAAYKFVIEPSMNKSRADDEEPAPAPVPAVAPPQPQPLPADQTTSTSNAPNLTIINPPSPVFATPLQIDDRNRRKQVIVNNNYYTVDFDRKFPHQPKSKEMDILLLNFNMARYAKDNTYKRQINAIVAKLPKIERDYWRGILSRVVIVPKPVPIPVPVPTPCVQHVACALGTHWDSHACKCVNNRVPLPNTHEHNGHLVPGASSHYSRTSLYNTGKILIN